MGRLPGDERTSHVLTWGRLFNTEWPVHRPRGGFVGGRLVWLAVCEGQGEELERAGRKQQWDGVGPGSAT